jgi:hypothetical protein
MVEDALVGNVVFKEPLTPAMMDAGEALMRQLDQMAAPITVAFWFFDAEIAEWRFMFASPEVSVDGGRGVQRRVQEALDILHIAPDVIPRSSIRVFPIHDDLVRRLRTALHTGDDVKRIRLRRDYAEGRYVEDALVYRAA